MATDRASDRRDDNHELILALDELIDLEFEAFCAHEGDESVTLDEVLKATASIPGSMAESIAEDERAERF
jgi:hypothetical protein